MISQWSKAPPDPERRGEAWYLKKNNKVCAVVCRDKQHGMAWVLYSKDPLMFVVLAHIELVSDVLAECDWLVHQAHNRGPARRTTAK